MLSIALTQDARALFKRIAEESLHAFIELDAKLYVVGNAGLVAEPLLAVVNHTHDVYLLAPARPAPRILMVHSPATPDEATVTDFPRVRRLENRLRRRLATSAVTSLGIVVRDVYLPR